MRAIAAVVASSALIASVGTLRSAPSGPDLPRVREAARAEIASGNAPGLAPAVVYEGQLVLAERFGVANVETGAPVTPETVFQVGSVGKMLTAAAVLETAATGKLTLREPVGRVVQELDPAIGALTLDQLSGRSDEPAPSAVPARAAPRGRARLPALRVVGV